MIPIKKPIASISKSEMRLTAASTDNKIDDETVKTENGATELDHEKFMKENGIKTVDLSEEIKEIDKVLKSAKDDDFESANEVSRLVVEALKEKIFEINENIEQIGESLHDHEERIEALESGEIAEKSDVTPGITPGQTPTMKLTDEQILAKLFSENVNYISKQELAALGFKTGFFSKLSARGADYGAYSLVKKPSEKVFEIIQN